MNAYDAISYMLALQAKGTGTQPYDDHAATAYADMRDAYVYIVIGTETLAINKDGTATFV